MNMLGMITKDVLAAAVVTIMLVVISGLALSVTYAPMR